MQSSVPCLDQKKMRGVKKEKNKAKRPPCCLAGVLHNTIAMFLFFHETKVSEVCCTLKSGFFASAWDRKQELGIMGTTGVHLFVWLCLALIAEKSACTQAAAEYLSCALESAFWHVWLSLTERFRGFLFCSWDWAPVPHASAILSRLILSWLDTPVSEAIFSITGSLEWLKSKAKRWLSNQDAMANHPWHVDTKRACVLVSWEQWERQRKIIGPWTTPSDRFAKLGPPQP